VLAILTGVAPSAAHAELPSASSDQFPVTNGVVNVVVVHEYGGPIVIGGSFTTVTVPGQAPVARQNVAIVSNGAVADWNPGVNGPVHSLGFRNSDVIIGGQFSSVGGLTRNNGAAVDMYDGTIKAWHPDTNGTIRAIEVDRNKSTVFIGGDFTTVRGEARNRAAAVSLVNNVTPWNPSANGTVNALERGVDSDIIYAGGSFTSIGGQPRNNIAALESTVPDGTGAATSFNPNSACAVNDVEASHHYNIVADGCYAPMIGGSWQRLAQFTPSGAKTNWEPNPNAQPTVISYNGHNVYVGGPFTSIGGKARNQLAAIDYDGNATNWNPNVGGGTVRGIGEYYRPYAPPGGEYVYYEDVYVGGSFTSVGGQARSNLAGFIGPSDVNASSGSPPTLSGDAVQGEALVTTDGGWEGTPESFVYTWERCNVAGSGCAVVPGAKQRDYTMRAADIGSRMRATVTACDGPFCDSASTAVSMPVLPSTP
jgi:hypothetical protein